MDTATGTRTRSRAPRRRISSFAIGSSSTRARCSPIVMSATAARSCVIGATLKRELFEGESPIGKDIRIQNVTFRVIGVLSRKGANMVGQDQDDIVVAPWTTIKYLISGVLGQCRADCIGQPSSLDQVNSVSNLYPGATSLYLTPTTTEAADTPQPIRFITVRSDSRKSSQFRANPPGNDTAYRAAPRTASHPP